MKTRTISVENLARVPERTTIDVAKQRDEYSKQMIIRSLICQLFDLDEEHYFRLVEVSEYVLDNCETRRDGRNAEWAARYDIRKDVVSRKFKSLARSLNAVSKNKKIEKLFARIARRMAEFRRHSV